MRRHIYLLSSCLLLSLLGFSQNQIFNRKEIGDLDLRIENFIAQQDNIFSEERKSEFAQLVIETDSIGKIKEIGLAGTDTDSLYKIFKKMTPVYFSDWRGPGNKNIIIPYFYLSVNAGTTGNYVDAIFSDYYKKIPGGILVSASGNTIVFKWLMHLTPLRPNNEH
jgi:hypothetical protein